MRGAEPTTDIDRVNRFIIDRCQLNAKTNVKASILNASFAGYAAARGWMAISSAAFAAALEAIGIEKQGSGKTVAYKNLALRDATSEAAQ